MNRYSQSQHEVTRDDLLELWKFVFEKETTKNVEISLSMTINNMYFDFYIPFAFTVLQNSHHEIV